MPATSPTNSSRPTVEAIPAAVAGPSPMSDAARSIAEPRPLHSGPSDAPSKAVMPIAVHARATKPRPGRSSVRPLSGRRSMSRPSVTANGDSCAKRPK